MHALDTRYATRTLCKQSREYRKTWSTCRCNILLDELGLLSRLMARRNTQAPLFALYEGAGDLAHHIAAEIVAVG